MNILRKKEDFDRIFKQPEYKAGVPGLYLLARKNNLEYSRLGMAIPKKVIKKATGRNALKRRLRVAFKESMSRSRVDAGVGFEQKQPCLDSVVIARPPMGTFDKQKMTELAQKLFATLVQKSTHAKR